MLTHGFLSFLPFSAMASIYTVNPRRVRSVLSISSQALGFQWRPSPRFRRHGVSSPQTAIGSVLSSSGQALAFRWRSPRVRRHSASSPPGSSSDECCLSGITMDQLMCSPIFSHALLIKYKWPCPVKRLPVLINTRITYLVFASYCTTNCAPPQ